MKSAQSNLVIAFWLLVAGLFAADLWLLQAYTPTEVTMGADSENLLSASAGGHLHFHCLSYYFHRQSGISLATANGVG